MLDRELELLLQLSQKDPTLEFYLSLTRGSSVELRDGKLFLSENYQDLALTVRALVIDFDKKKERSGKAGLSLTLSLNKEALEQAISRAKALAEYGKEVAYPELSTGYPQVNVPSSKALSHEEMLSLLEQAREDLKDYPKVTRIEKESFSFEEEETLLIREGRVLRFKAPSYSYFVSVVSENGRPAQGYAYNSTRELEGLEARKLFRKACEMASALAKAKKGGTIKCAVLFPPESAILLIELLSFSFLGDEVVKGRSKLRDKLEKRVFNQAITIVDDGLAGTLPEGRPFDDEGVPQESSVLVEKGELKSFLLDLQSAKQLGFSSNGKARRPSMGQNPKPSPTNLYLEKGNSSREELLEAEDYVFEVYEILGSHTADPVSGEFSFGVSGVLYHKGEQAEFLSEMALTDNIFEVLSRDVLLGKDLTFYGSLGSPSILIPGMVLG